MTTQITKQYGPGQPDFTTLDQIKTYMATLDLLALNQNIKIVYHASLGTWQENMGPLTFDATRRVTFVPADAVNVNKLKTATLDIVPADCMMTWNRGQYGMEFKNGVSFEDTAILITGATDGQNIRFGQTASVDVLFERCLVLDQSTGTGTIIRLNQPRLDGKATFRRTLFIIDGGLSKTLFTLDFNHPLSMCTAAARGTALNNAALVVSGGNNGAVWSDLILAGFGSKIADATISLQRCYSNTTPTVGATTGVTVVVGAGALVTNEAIDFRLALGSLPIGKAPIAEQYKLDIFSKPTGEFPDTGAHQRVAAAVQAPPDSTITSIFVSGRRVTVSATFTGNALSGQITLVPAGGGTGVSVTKPAVISGNTATAIFDASTPGSYSNASVIMSNQATSGSSSGGGIFTVSAPPVPTAAITSVTRSGRNIVISGTYTGIYPNEPISGTASLTASSAPAVSKGPVALVLKSDGTFTHTFPSNPYGEYSQTSVSITNFSGAGTTIGAGISLPSPAKPVGHVYTSIDVVSQSTSAQTDVPFSFGLVFEEGFLPVSGAAIDLVAPDNTIVPCQIDVKTSNTDASVRWAILTARIPSLAASATINYNVVRKTATTSTALTPASVTGLAASIVIKDTGIDAAGPTAGTIYTADAAPLLAANTYASHMAGPIASEFLMRVPFKTAGGVVHPHLHARIYMRIHAGQAVKTDFIVENTWAKPKSVASGSSPWEPGVSDVPVIATLEFKLNGVTVHARAVKGYVETPASNSSGVYGLNATGLANDATVYTAAVTIDGVAKALSITGSAAQNYDQLLSLINSQLGAAGTCTSGLKALGLRIQSATTGANSSAVITDRGTLFPAIAGTNTRVYRPMRGDEHLMHPEQIIKQTHWSVTTPAIHVAYDKAYLVKTRAMPNVPISLTGATSRIDAHFNALKANEDFGRNGISKAYMGDQGFAPGIGIIPEWDALWLVNQGPRAKYIMLKMADLSGSWPTHRREFDTDYPIDFAKWPYATTSPNAGDSGNPATGLQEKLPVSSVSIPQLPPCDNQPDTAHHPLLTFTAAMVTGDYFYLEEMAFYNRFMNLTLNAAYRNGGQGIFSNDQVRGQAWTIRTAVHNMYLLPDNYPLKTNISNILANNLSWYETNYLAPGAPWANNFGVIRHNALAVAYGDKFGQRTGVATFMDDFFTAACGRAVELGFSEWLPMLHFKSKFGVGRMTSGPDFCFLLGGSLICLSIAATTDGPVFTTFGQMYQQTVADSIIATACGSVAMKDAILAQNNISLEGARDVVGAMAGYPDTPGGYSANLQPALAYAASYGALNADNAWMVFESRNAKPDYNFGPQFSIAPRPAEVTATPVDTTQPTLIGALTPSAITSSGFTVTWPAASDNGGIAGYEYSIGNGAYTTVPGGAAARSHACGPVAASTSYTFNVRAFDAAGNRSTPPLSIVVTTSAATSGRTATVTLSSAVSLSNLEWAWFDQMKPSLFTAPTDKGAVETTTADGVLVVNLPNSTLSVGQTGWLEITNSDGSPATAHKGFGGPVTVS